MTTYRPEPTVGDYGNETKIVCKWSVPLGDIWTPIGAGPVVHVAFQYSAPTVWTLENAPNVGSQVTPTRAAQCFATGERIDPEEHGQLVHLGTCADMMSALVWHIFGAQ